MDKHTYYIGRYVVLKVDAANQQFLVELNGEPLKTVAIKGLQRGEMSLEAYVAFIGEQAVSAWRTYVRKRRQYLPLAA